MPALIHRRRIFIHKAQSHVSEKAVGQTVWSKRVENTNLYTCTLSSYKTTPHWRLSPLHPNSDFCSHENCDSWRKTEPDLVSCAISWIAKYFAWETWVSHSSLKVGKILILDIHSLMRKDRFEAIWTWALNFASPDPFLCSLHQCVSRRIPHKTNV